MAVETPQTALSPEKRETILTKMRRYGRYQGRICGHRLILWRKIMYNASITADQVVIGYQLNGKWGRKVAHGVASSITDALALVSAALDPSLPPPLPATPVEDQRNTVLPFDQLRLKTPERTPYADS